MTATDDEPTGRKFSEAVIREGLQELANLYQHDYAPASMPELRPGTGFADDREVERLGRLIGVVLKKSVATAVDINPASSNTGSGFGYEFDSGKLEAPAFALSEPGKTYASLLERTKLMIEEGVQPEIAQIIVEDIYTLPPDERAARFARELAREGRTFRAFLQAVRFVTCNPSVRASLASLLALQAGTPATAAAAASLLVSQFPWLALYPPAMVAGVVALITVMGVEGFCAWSGPYLEKFSQIEDPTPAGKNG